MSRSPSHCRLYVLLDGHPGVKFAVVTYVILSPRVNPFQRTAWLMGFDCISEEKRFIYKDANMQVRAIWHKKNVHANDWMYFTWTRPWPKDSDRMAITIADQWSPGLVGYEFNQFAAIIYLDIARRDQVPRENL